MRKIKFYLHTGFACGVHEDEIEFEDNTTDEQIDEELEEWSKDQIDAWWMEVRG